jgi:ParB family chromosome partitioning protein
MAFMGQKAEIEGEVRTLREQLKKFAESMPTKKLDCAMVAASRWANRHHQAYQTAAFLRLKDDIKLSGGNVQPILVYHIAGEVVPFRIVFGHRRYAACRELGLPVLAAVYEGSMSDKELFSAMDRENREREDLSAYEQGRMYRMALDEGLYPSARRLAEDLGVSHTWVNKSLIVADLPVPVVECFRSPLEIQHRHALALTQALHGDSRSVLKRAEKLRGKNLAPGTVVDELAGLASGVSGNEPVVLKGKGGARVDIAFYPKKQQYAINLYGLKEDRLPEVKQLISKLLA